MLDFYTWKTPNGRKVAIMLAETQIEHTLHAIDIGKGEQHRPDFLAISPNNKIPAIVDRRDDGSSLSLFESGAILTYLAEKSGMLLPGGEARWTTLKWLHWSIGGVGPMIGQLNYFVNHADEPVPPAIERYAKEASRLIGVLDTALRGSGWVDGNAYSIADIVSYPWIAEARRALGEPLREAFANASAVRDWLDRVGERPAVKAGMAVLQDDAS